MAITINDIKEAFDGKSMEGLHVGKHIPVKMLIRAREAMKIRESYADILALYDSCILFQNGSEGCVIVPDGIYLRCMSVGYGFHGWNDISFVCRNEQLIHVNEHVFGIKGSEDDAEVVEKGLLKLIDTARRREKGNVEDADNRLVWMPKFLEPVNGGLKIPNVFNVGGMYTGLCQTLPETEGRNAMYSTCYICPTEVDRDMLMFINIGMVVDDVDFSKKINKHNIGGYENAWPLFTRGLLNGKNENYSDSIPALKPMPIPGSNDTFFLCAVTKLQNIGTDELFDDYANNKKEMLFKYVLGSVEELKTRQVSTIDSMKGFMNGFVEGAAKWRRITNALDLLGRFL